MSIRKLKAVVVAAAVAAGVAVSSAPAQASVCSSAGREYICEYKVATYNLPNNTKQNFVVGADYAVWTRWTDTNNVWGPWISMGGNVRSSVSFLTPTSDPWNFLIIAMGTDNNTWGRERDHNGNWSAWFKPSLPFNG
ncbi:hypothetical protein ACI1MP_01125 [Kitasatospora griseola]|uniref:hypothetical protein n=1 Tax=Kitasatospora griseola TaxID=2064 RepID=UPI003855DAE3